jgi:hypothetical protein
MTISDIVTMTAIASQLATVIALILAIGFGIGQLRDLQATRYMEMVFRIWEIWDSEEMHKAYLTLRNLSFVDYTDFKTRFPPGSQEWRYTRILSNFFNSIGFLARKKQLDVEMIVEFFRGTLDVWPKVQPIIEGFREDFDDPACGVEFEWLYSMWIHSKLHPSRYNLSRRKSRVLSDNLHKRIMTIPSEEKRSDKGNEGSAVSQTKRKRAQHNVHPES